MAIYDAYGVVVGTFEKIKINNGQKGAGRKLRFFGGLYKVDWRLWDDVTARYTYNEDELCVQLMWNLFLGSLENDDRLRWNARIPVPRGAEEGALRETCGYLGLRYVAELIFSG